MLQLLLDRFFLLKRFFSDPASMFCQLIYQPTILPLIVVRRRRVAPCSPTISTDFLLFCFPWQQDVWQK